MADPLCRWHYALPKNVVELVRALPKTEMPRSQFLNQLSTTLSEKGYSFDFATFQKTAYQLAVQLGLYYIDDSDIYHPRFSSEINEETAAKYLAVVAQCYVAPNPYTNTKSFGTGQLAINLHSALVGYSATLPAGASFDVNDALSNFFSAPLGNPDAVTALMAASPNFTKVGNKSLAYAPATQNSMSRKEFFDLFAWPNSEAKQCPKQPPLPENILFFALECFRKERANVKAPAGWNNFDAWAKAARSAFDAVDESKATDQNFDYAKFMREFAISVQVANTKFAGHSADEKTAVLKFLREQKVNPQVVTWYLDGTHRPKINGEDVKGMGVTATLFFMMEIHPDLYASWSEMAYDSLSKVGLHSGPAPTKLTLQSYDDCKAKQCQVLAKMNEMGIGKAADDPSDADYITANEFLWFVSEQYDLIMKEWSKHMKKEIKLENQDSIDISKFEDFIKAFHKAAEDAGLTYDLALVKRFVCALLAKPFVVLTGLSGSGKTKLAQAFTQWIALSETARIVPVGADWANNEKLLGYPNGLDPNNYILPDTGVLKLMIDANDNPTVPFFLILDEMNLSHVERYFADFLSAMESNGSIKLYDGKNRTADDGTPVPPTIPFPKNLFVIGTMNVDETTHMFSPKVLDRAQVIEFRVTAEQMANYLDNPQKLDMTQVDGKGLKFAEAFLKLHNTPAELDGDDKKTVADALKQFFPTLAELGSEFAFRTASEAKLFCAFARKANLSVEESVDAAIMQKLLPKLHGSRRRLALPLEAFWEFCREDGKTETLGDICKKDATVKVTDVAKYKVSAEKIKRLYKAAETNGFASYAEA